MKKSNKNNVEKSKYPGLITAVVQDYRNGEVLMVAYMSRESLKKSMETGLTWFWSRSRKKLWQKGEKSGNIQKIKDIKYDCDGDALLISVEQVGNACHTGNRSCFYRTLKNLDKDIDFKETSGSGSKKNILDELYGVIKSRISDKTPGSYTYSLHKKGLDEIIKKLGEESMEVVLASKHQDKKSTIHEIADLLYHLLVLMAEKNITLREAFDELERRRK
jgi:phosphoribosyl-ATP pyrophosphohydrolase/phosphoribosyl-AMP cyclohydrolase